MPDSEIICDINYKIPSRIDETLYAVNIRTVSH
jgi:hypothetical protein